MLEKRRKKKGKNSRILEVERNHGNQLADVPRERSFVQITTTADEPAVVVLIGGMRSRKNSKYSATSFGFLEKAIEKKRKNLNEQRKTLTLSRLLKIVPDYWMCLKLIRQGRRRRKKHTTPTHNYRTRINKYTGTARAKSAFKTADSRCLHGFDSTLSSTVFFFSLPFVR